MPLLTVGNPKTAKGEKYGYLTAILHLAPATMSGYNVCPMATKGCSAVCLNTAGRGGMFAGEKTADLSGSEMVEAIKSGKLVNKIQAARIRKTRMFYEHRQEFMNQLVKEIMSFVKLAQKHGLTPAVRLNGTSDIRWETIGIFQEQIGQPHTRFTADNIMKAFPDVQFYDYTKIANRRNLPKNYHLTFSLAESNDSQAKMALKNGMNVAVVFRTAEYPKTFMETPVVNGDDSDLRFLDPKGVIVGLKAKGKAKRDDSGFVREVE
jgi:hypothetical protein